MINDNKWKSLWDEKPTKGTGWYPVLICWEPEEGFFPYSAYWTGEIFTSSKPITNFIDSVFSSKILANEEAFNDDPNW